MFAGGEGFADGARHLELLRPVLVVGMGARQRSAGRQDGLDLVGVEGMDVFCWSQASRGRRSRREEERLEVRHLLLEQYLVLVLAQGFLEQPAAAPFEVLAQAGDL